MFYRPEFVIYLWILPVLVMIVVPVLWTMTRLLYHMVERSRLGDVRGFIDLNGAASAGEQNQERRGSPRIRIEGSRVSVARQVKCCRAKVANISSRGICLAGIPRKMDKETDARMKVVFRTRARDYTMQIQPKWKKLDDKGYMIGAEIVEIPQGWNYFVKGLSRPVMAKAA